MTHLRKMTPPTAALARDQKQPGDSPSAIPDIQVTGDVPLGHSRLPPSLLVTAHSLLLLSRTFSLSLTLTLSLFLILLSLNPPPLLCQSLA